MKHFFGRLTYNIKMNSFALILVLFPTFEKIFLRLGRRGRRLKNSKTKDLRIEDS